MIDAEIISIPVKILKTLGLKGIKVNINSLGDIESRNNYRTALKNYFSEHLDILCDDCKARYERNPLRIIDCKTDSNLDIIKNAPIILDYLNDESKKYFEKVKECLTYNGKDVTTSANITYEVNPRIVRGLDYYTHTVFEITAEIDGFGSQNVLCGGGRYNNLVSSLGGPDTPAVGFGMGIERLINALDMENIIIDKKDIDVYVCYVTDNEKNYAFKLLNDLRNENIKCDMSYMTKSLKSQFKDADINNPKYIIIIGNDEVKENVLTVKNNITKEEYKVNKNEISKFIKEN